MDLRRAGNHHKIKLGAEVIGYYFYDHSCRGWASYRVGEVEQQAMVTWSKAAAIERITAEPSGL